MLSILADRQPQLCDGLSRREFLRIGGLGAAGLSLADLIRQPSTAETAAQQGKARSCIVLFLMGGPPQHSTWDPKPNAPAEVRGEFAPISTAVPGLAISELLPKTATLAQKVCLKLLWTLGFPSCLEAQI